MAVADCPTLISQTSSSFNAPKKLSDSFAACIGPHVNATACHFEHCCYARKPGFHRHSLSQIQTMGALGCRQETVYPNIKHFYLLWFNTFYY